MCDARRYGRTAITDYGSDGGIVRMFVLCSVPDGRTVPRQSYVGNYEWVTSWAPRQGVSASEIKCTYVDQGDCDVWKPRPAVVSRVWSYDDCVEGVLRNMLKCPIVKW